MDQKDMYSNQIYSFLTLRKAVGWIGILIPFTMMIGMFILFDGNVVQKSISNYYYTGMRDVLVGAICAIALFMFFYRGYDKWDDWAGNLAGLSAIGVAWFPTAEAGPNNFIGLIHFISAALFFLTLAVFSLFLFTKKGSNPTPRKRTRNIIYIICGLVIIICLMAIWIYFNLINNDKEKCNFVFWAETLALIAFGISWLTKGGTLYADKKETNS
jgi:hypothetical protein